MEINLFRVVSQGDVTYVASKRQQGGQVAKSVIRLKELGGSYESEYLCTLFGNIAQCRFAEGDVVAAKLHFKVNEAGGQMFQDIVVTDIIKINNV